MTNRWENFFNEKHEINYPAMTMYQLIRESARK